MSRFHLYLYTCLYSLSTSTAERLSSVRGERSEIEDCFRTENDGIRDRYVSFGILCLVCLPNKRLKDKSRAQHSIERMEWSISPPCEKILPSLPFTSLSLLQLASTILAQAQRYDRSTRERSRRFLGSFFIFPSSSSYPCLSDPTVSRSDLEETFP